MSQSAEPMDKLAAGVDVMFDHPAFGSLKARAAAFVLVRVSDGKVLWVNEPAAAFWGTRDLDALGRQLAGQASLGLESLVRGTPLWAAPRLGRLRFVHALRLRNHIMLFRTGTDADGALLMGLALPETAEEHQGHADAWRRGPGEPGRTDSPASLSAESPPDPVEMQDPDPNEAAAYETDGLSLARRSQIAVLRDRLNAAADGASSLRLLWRTDADDAVTQIDTDTFARLSTPGAFDHENLSTVIGAWDAEAGVRVADALATRATWHGITVRLPVADAVAWVPMTLSASPVFASGRRFSGFRGFGTIDLTQIELSPVRERASPSHPLVDDAPGVEPDLPRPPGGEAGVEPGAEAASSGQHLGPAAGEPESGVPDGSPHRRDLPEPPFATPDPDRGLSLANVVHLRPFQTGGVGRFGALPQKDAIEDLRPAEATADAPPPQKPSDETEDREGEAFRALRDALLAQIPLEGAAASADGPQDSPEMQERSGDGDTLPDTEPSSTPAEASDEPRESDTEGPGAVGPGLHPSAAEPTPEFDLVDHLPFGVLVIGTGVPLFANPAAAGRLGYASVADLIGKGQQLVVSDISVDDTGTLVLRDAEDRAVAIPAERQIIGWRGRPAALWTIGLPMPERPAAGSSALEAAAEAGEQPDPRDHGSGALLDRVDDAVALLDADGHVRRLNRRGETWFMRPGQESALGSAFTQLLAPDSRAAGVALLGDLKGLKEGAGAAPLQREVIVRTIDLTPMPVLLTMGRLGASGFYMTLRDVTALKRAERDQVRAERDHERDSGRLPEFLAKVSHEIRTPLNAILGFAEVMIEERFGPLGNVRYKDYLRDIHASGTQVVSLVSDLLDLSRIEAGRLELEVGALDVNKIVSETVAKMQAEAHRERVIMRMSLGARTPAVLADERSVRQIVQNLLSNAVKFNEPGGQVIVSTALSDGGTVVLRVRDTGIGMTDAEIAAALEPFQPVSTQKPSTGNGLGLPLTRALVGANGASMAIRSRPREGTLVEVAFALASADAARLPA